MTSAKNNRLLPAGLISLCLVLTSGCAEMNLLNPTFLNEYQPLGQTSLNNLQAAGPVSVVIEDLTREARHQEKTIITINYVDANGNLQILQRTLLAVPENERNPAAANFNSAYREVIILDCGVREIWFTATVYRTDITTKTDTVVLGNQQSQTINYCSASILRVPSDVRVAATDMVTLQYATYAADQIFPFHLQETLHYKCGDVILLGLLDERLQTGNINLQTYTCDYTDLNSLSRTFADNLTNPNLFPSGTNPRYLFNPTQSAITEEYQYPAAYVLVPLVLPNIAGVDGAESQLVQLAIQNAKH